MTKRNFRSKVLIDPVCVGENIVFHGNNNQHQQTMKRQRPAPAPAAPELFSSFGRPVSLRPPAENDGFGEEETSESIERKFSKITRRGDDDSVQIIFDANNTGRDLERKPEDVTKIKNPGNIFRILLQSKFPPLNK